MDSEEIATLDPLNRPVTVVQGPEPPSPGPRAARPSAAPVDHGAVRRALHARLSGLTGEDEAHGAATRLLRPDAPRPPAPVVDELVGLATLVVHGEKPADAVTRGTDRFVLAASLYLRAQPAAGAVPDRYAGLDPDDLLAAAEHLIVAAEMLPTWHPAAVVVLLALGAFLPDGYPLGAVLDRFADRFAERAEAAVAASGARDPALATVFALRHVYRAAVDVRAGRPVDLAAIERAVSAVPDDYPWRYRLEAAIDALR